MKPSDTWRRISFTVLLLGAVTVTPVVNAELRGSSRQTQAVGEILKLRLIDAEADQPIAAYDPLPASSVIDVYLLPNSFVNIEALTEGTIGSIQWNHNGRVRNEDFAPWALCGNSGRDFSPCTRLKMDTNSTIQATPYSGRNASGTAGPTLTIQLALMRSSSPVLMQPTLTLVNAETDEDIGPLVNGTVIDLSQTPNINVRADPDTSVVTDSVEFGYDGRVYRVENDAPYAFHGNRGRDYLSGWTPSVGRHTITAAAFADNNAQGTFWSSATVSFQVVSPEPVPTTVAPTPMSPTSAPLITMPPFDMPIWVEPPPTTPDVTKPQLLNFSIMSPTIIDTSEGDVTVLVEVVAQDDRDAFYGIDVWAFGGYHPNNPIGQGLGRWSTWIKGVPLENSYEGAKANTQFVLPFTLTFPKNNIALGTYNISVGVTDNSVNIVEFNAKTLAARGLPSTLTVINSKNNSLQDNLVDVRIEEYFDRLHVVVTTKAGLDEVNMIGYDSIGSQSPSWQGSNSVTTTYTFVYFFNSYADGLRVPFGLEFVQSWGRFIAKRLSSADLIALGYPGAFVIDKQTSAPAPPTTATPTAVFPTAGPQFPTWSPTWPPSPQFAFVPAPPVGPDRTPPELVDFVLLSPSLVDVAKGDVSVKFQVTARDNQNSFYDISVEAKCVGPVGSGSSKLSSRFAPLPRIPANTTVTFNRTIIFPKYYTVPGNCTFMVRIADNAALVTDTNATALAARNLPHQLTLKNTQGSLLTRLTALANTTINLAPGKQATIRFEVWSHAEYKPLIHLGGNFYVYPDQTILGRGNTAKFLYSLRYTEPKPDGDYPIGLFIESQKGISFYFETADLMARGFPSKITVKSS